MFIDEGGRERNINQFPPTQASTGDGTHNQLLGMMLQLTEQPSQDKMYL